MEVVIASWSAGRGSIGRGAGRLPQIRLADGTDDALLQRWVESPALALAQVHGRDLSRPRLVFLIEQGDGVGPVGAVELFNVDGVNRRAEIGVYLADGGQRGRGTGLLAARRVLETALAIGLARLEARIMACNNGVLELAERAGFRREGLLRQAVWRDGKPQDVVLLAMLPSDFLQRFGRLPRLAAGHAGLAGRIALAVLVSTPM